jgi:hypothetical protein
MERDNPFVVNIHANADSKFVFKLAIQLGQDLANEGRVVTKVEGPFTRVSEHSNQYSVRWTQLSGKGGD